MKSPNVTLAVCTYNRLALLRKCLHEIQRLNASNIPVMCIDNNSTDGTADFLKTLDDIQVIYEKKTGLSHARNKALEMCRTKYLAFMDDDAYPTETYFSELESLCMGEFEVAGGVQIPFTDGSLPEWVESSQTRTPEYLSGFNIIFKVKSLRELGGFDAQLGMSGKNIAYGEEVRPQVEFKKNGGVILFEPNLKVHHYLQPERLTLGWQLRAAYAHGRDRWLLFNLPPPGYRDMIYLLRRLILAAVVFYRGRSQYKQIAFKAGEIHGGWSMRRKASRVSSN